MNLLSTIGQYIRDGLSHAEIVVKLDVEHAIQVSEEWIAKIRSADGFALVAGSAEGVAGAVATDAKDAAVEAGDVADAVVKDVGAVIEPPKE